MRSYGIGGLGRAAALAAAALLLGATAQATPVVFTVNPATTLNIKVTAVVSGNANTTVTGTDTTDLTNPLAPPSTLTASSSNLSFSNVTITLPFVGAIATNGVKGGLTGGPVISTGTNPLNFNLAGFTFTLDQGTLVTSGSIGANTINLATSPLSFILPTTASTIAVTPTGGGTASLLWTIPVSITTTLPTTLSPTVLVTGTLKLSGVYVPEPTTAILLTAGLAGLAALGRKRNGA